MSGDTLVGQLQSRFGDKITGSNLEAMDPWIEVSPDGLVELMTFLKEDAELKFDMLNCITAVDYIQTDPKKAAKADFDPHLEVVYHLSSIQKKHTLVVKVMLPRWKDDVEGQLPQVPNGEHHLAYRGLA